MKINENLKENKSIEKYFGSYENSELKLLVFKLYEKGSILSN